MSREYDFAERLAFSRGIAETTHPDTIIKLIPGCVDVQRTSKTEDRRGIDFKAILRRGAELNIDIKSREKGCSKFWQPYRFGQGIEPELALEKYSVAPPSAIENPIVEEPKTGWTLDESKETDYTPTRLRSVGHDRSLSLAIPTATNSVQKTHRFLVRQLQTRSTIHPQQLWIMGIGVYFRSRLVRD